MSARQIREALMHLPQEDKWEIARWLLDELQEEQTSPQPSEAPQLPDYARLRTAILGERELPNLVMAARNEERW